MLRTLINICDREYLFTCLLSSYLFPTTLLSLLGKRRLFPCFSLSLVHPTLHVFTPDMGITENLFTFLFTPSSPVTTTLVSLS